MLLEQYIRLRDHNVNDNGSPTDSTHAEQVFPHAASVASISAAGPPAVWFIILQAAYVGVVLEQPFLCCCPMPCVCLFWGPYPAQAPEILGHWLGLVVA